MDSNFLGHIKFLYQKKGKKGSGNGKIKGESNNYCNSELIDE
jgi:hypothetical protein